MTTRSKAQQLSSYIPLASFFAVLAGTLYLWGYWSGFDVNILQYIGLMDLAKAAAFPLVSAVAAIAFGQILGQLLARETLPLRPGGGADTAIGRFLRKYRKVLLVLYVGVMFAFLSIDNDGKWLVVPAMAIPLVATTIHERGLLSDVISDPAMRGTALGLLLLVISSAFGFGRIRAGDVISGRDYFVIDQSSVRHMTGLRTTATGELKYLGHAGDYLFLLSPDSSIQILRADSVPVLVIKHRRTTPKASG